MKVPINPREVRAPIHGQAAAPVFGPRPPYHRAGEAKQRKAHTSDAIDEVAGGSRQQVFVKADEPLDNRVSRQFITKNNRAAGNTHQQNVRAGNRPYPEMNLENDILYE